jgi:hypothetical protein
VCAHHDTENGGGGLDAPGVVDIIKNGQVVGAINGDGSATVCGPATLKVHLKSGEDDCKIKVTAI